MGVLKRPELNQTLNNFEYPKCNLKTFYDTVNHRRSFTMARRKEKQPVHHVKMTEGKRGIQIYLGFPKVF